jgi:uncharacterized ferritin-like protein (DUF455 family)
MEELKNESERKREELVTLKVSEEMHARVFDIIYEDKKKHYKNADAVLRFLFQQYDEKIKQKLNSIRNKDSNCIFKIPLQAIEDAGLKPGDDLDISVEGNQIILEKRKI